MRKLFTLFVIMALTISVFAQAPQKMSYQAVIRNSSGQLVTNHTVGMKVSILEGSVTGTVVFSETYSPSPQSNANGLVTVEIGSGTPVTGTFTGINWASGPYYLRTETDPTGGTSYTITGSSQILSVPYAFYAEKSGNLDALLERILKIEAELGVQDLDSNTYKTVKIGSQVWMAENLKTTKFNDGTAIPYAPGDELGQIAWEDLTTPAYCWPVNQITRKDVFGALYNWQTVSTGKLCPKGWHVPSDVEWLVMENYLIDNGYNYDGTTSGNKYSKSLASTSNWHSSFLEGAVGNTDYLEKRNVTGFNAIPAGCRTGWNGDFESMGYHSYYWTSTLDESMSSAYYWYLDYDRICVYRETQIIRMGYSVKCLKDN